MIIFPEFQLHKPTEIVCNGETTIPKSWSCKVSGELKVSFFKTFVNNFIIFKKLKMKILISCDK